MSQALLIAEIYSFIELEDEVELRKYDLKIISLMYLQPDEFLIKMHILSAFKRALQVQVLHYQTRN